MPFTYNEQSYENAIIELFQNMGYSYVYGRSVENRDFYSPFYEDVLVESISRINPNAPQNAIQDALFKLKNIEHGELLQQNMVFMDYLQSGIEVSYTENGEHRTTIIYLVDFDRPENNSFIVANQWDFIENSKRRPDVLIFLNGMPVALFELKSLVREGADTSCAYRQIKNYQKEIPSMFVYNAICVISDLQKTKAGTITSSEDRYMEWKSKDGEIINGDQGGFNTLIEGIFTKEHFLDILKNFICFNKDGVNTFKILAGYHQYFAVKKAIELVKKATETDGRGGVFWHTQGSGKSLSMVFFAHLLQSALNSPTIVVLTDRNDLDNQLYGQFSRCQDFLRQKPEQAESRTHLKQLLNDRIANGIIFTTMQKFEESAEPLSERRNIVVMADEAHRGQYGLTEKVNTKTGEVKTGYARVIRNILPNATFIGFTGTPVSVKDRNTREVFGNDIDIYDMSRAVQDGATRPIYYESRVMQLHLDPDILALIDKEYDLMASNADEEVIEQSKHQLAKMEAVLGNDNTINSLVADILKHYEENREKLLTGKAMIVAYSRSIAMKIYRKILELRPEWKEANRLAVVMTSGNNDPEDWREVIGNKNYRDELARRFKDNEDSLKIVIVVDMWLTGFDVPSLATMYVYKPMAGHNLMQAIARVNRVFGDKEGGLIVDYVGIATALKRAMNDYTVNDRKNYGNMDISSTAYRKFKEKLEVCSDLLHGFDFAQFKSGTDLDRANAIVGAGNFLVAPDKDETKQAYKKEALLLHQALSLCSSIATADERMDAAFFEAVRMFIIKLDYDGNSGKKISLPEMNERINELLKQSLKSDGVINLFADVKGEFSLFDPQFLEEISKMKEKNLAVEILKRLLAEQVSVYRRTNCTKSEKFSEMIRLILNSYINGLITNAEVIEELIKIAKQITEAENDGKEMGLSKEELAFYDALTKPQAIKDFYANEQLVALTRELTDTLRKNKTIDWQRKESGRANMKIIVKKLLKKYNYPPEGQEDAAATVMTQCELWSDYEMEI